MDILSWILVGIAIAVGAIVYGIVRVVRNDRPHLNALRTGRHRTVPAPVDDPELPEGWSVWDRTDDGTRPENALPTYVPTRQGTRAPANPRVRTMYRPYGADSGQGEVDLTGDVTDSEYRFRRTSTDVGWEPNRYESEVDPADGRIGEFKRAYVNEFVESRHAGGQEAVGTAPEPTRTESPDTSPSSGTGSHSGSDGAPSGSSSE